MAQEEWFDVVDEQDRVVGAAPRREVHARGLLHRAVHALVLDRDGRVLLQKRSATKDMYPNQWATSASGHVDRGEDYDTAIVRELGEELGIHLPAVPEKLFPIAACEQTGREFVWIYRCQHDGPVVAHPEEISEIGWFTLAAVDRWTTEHPEEFAPSFLLVWQKWRSG